MDYIIWLSLCLNYSNRQWKNALKEFKNCKNIFNLDNSARQKSGYFTKNELEKMKSVTLDDVLNIKTECEKSDIKIVTFDDEKYPFCLSVIENPPILFYYKGILPDFDNTPSACIVGPRNISIFGKKSAFSLSYRLSRAGFIIVSGGALGSDTYSHFGALKADGITVLVMGCGINAKYLEENQGLRENILKKGCLISEFPPSLNASRFTFPIRNRIMSALSLCTILIEAPKRSGSLITANFALEQGRDVFVIPGAPNAKEYEGSNSLLRDGARPLLDSSDIFNEYIGRFVDKIDIERAFEKNKDLKLSLKEEKTVKPKKKSNKKVPDKENITEKTDDDEKIIKNNNITLSKNAEIVYNLITTKFFYPEEIKNTNLDTSEILGAITELEIEMLIRSLPGGRYELINNGG